MPGEAAPDVPWRCHRSSSGGRQRGELGRLISDVFSKTKRSEVMSRIRGAGNRDTELRLIQIFKENDITGWRRNRPVFGKPDFVFPKLKLAVFVDGCFWHGCPRHATWPKNNAAFWRKKIAANRSRDRRVNRTLRDRGWRVVRIWEHELIRTNQRRLRARLRRCLRTPDQ